MGDHPLSWYKQLPTGGRFFYTALGHRADIWESARTFRRQIYNAILWTAKYDSLAQTVSIQPGARRESLRHDMRFSTTPGRLTVTVGTPDKHTIELSELNGKRIATARGDGSEATHEFSGLNPGVYIVTLNNPRGRTTRLASIGP